MKLCEGAGCCESGGTAERGSGVGSSSSLADLLLAQEGEKLKGTERKVVLIHSSWHSRGRKEGSPGAVKLLRRKEQLGYYKRSSRWGLEHLSWSWGGSEIDKALGRSTRSKLAALAL